MSLRPYLVLMRPANIVTAIADILAGASIAGLMLFTMPTHSIISLVYLILSTIGLYGGGVVLNDVFDIKIDQKERPERPIPSGAISLRNAGIFAISLYCLGVLSAFLVSPISGTIAIAIVLFASVYDKWAKHHKIFGPLFMGICRGLNLSLGMSFIIEGIESYWWLSIIPILFIAAITLTSQGEVSGNNKKSIIVAMILDIVIAFLLISLSFYGMVNLIPVVPFLALWLGMNIYAKLNAIKNNISANVMKAVKMGVISLIPLNACLAAGIGNWYMGLIILCLLPFSLFLARFFAVT